MNPYLKLFDIIPGWLWAVVVALTLAWGGVTSVQLSHERLVHANLVRDVAKAAGVAEHVAREDAQKIADLRAQHATNQQENINEARKREVARVARERALAADNERLRNDILAASRRRETAPDAASRGRDGDLAGQLGGDLAEAVGLQGEAEAALRRRDDEVRLLLRQIHTDRAAVDAQ